jgi:hypothetical protein
MRRLALTVFFCLAACGGAVTPSGTGAVDPSTDMRAVYQRYLFTAEARATIAEFAKVSSQDALDSCLAAWVDELGGPSGLNDPIAKPDVKGLRSFLAECLGTSVPVDARAGGQASMRIGGAGNSF